MLFRSELHQIGLIDMVVVNLYPFESTVQKPGVPLEEVIENIDIGGPSMLRSAAKNYKSVSVLVNPKHYNLVLEELRTQKAVSVKTNALLAYEAYSHTAKYDAAISAYFQENVIEESNGFPETLVPVLKKVSTLRYGENPHQAAAFYKLDNLCGIPTLNQLHGKELSYNNISDLESALQIVNEFDQPAASIIKHANPCGTAIASVLSDAYQKAYESDPVSAFGSIVGLNREVDLETAKKIAQTFVEVVVAPGFQEEAKAVLMQKPALRLIELSCLQSLGQSLTYKYVDGGFLVQTPDTKHAEQEKWKVVTKKQPSDTLLADLDFAFKVVKHVKSNAILDRKSTRLNSSHSQQSRMPSSA